MLLTKACNALFKVCLAGQAWAAGENAAVGTVSGLFVVPYPDVYLDAKFQPSQNLKPVWAGVRIPSLQGSNAGTVMARLDPAMSVGLGDTVQVELTRAHRKKPSGLPLTESRVTAVLTKRNSDSTASTDQQKPTGRDGALMRDCQ